MRLNPKQRGARKLMRRFSVAPLVDLQKVLREPRNISVMVGAAPVHARRLVDTIVGIAMLLAVLAPMVLGSALRPLTRLGRHG